VPRQATTLTSCSPRRRNRVLSRWRVFAGAVAQTSPHGMQLGVQAVIYHGGYLPFRDPNSEENSNDIALVHLSSPLPLTGRSASAQGLQRQTG
jgi:hepsin